MADATTLSTLTTVVKGRPTKEQLPKLGDALQTIRVVLGLLAGVIAGVIPLTGWNGFILAAAIVAFLPNWYVQLVLQVPTGLPGEWSASELMTEGSYAGILYGLGSWITVYTLLHTPDGASFQLLNKIF